MTGLVRRWILASSLAVTAPLALALSPHDASAAPTARVGSARGSALVHGSNEMFAVIDNDSDEPLRGTFSVDATLLETLASATFEVAPHDRVRVHLPTRVAYMTNLRVVTSTGKSLVEESRNFDMPGDVWTFDLTDIGALRTMDRALPSMRVAAPDRDGKQSVVPRYGGTYAPFALVVAPVDRVAALGAAELEALTTFVLGGGTLALYAKHPDDLRSPIVEAFAGGIVASGKPPASLLAPSPASPAPLDATELSGAFGGNLEESRFGAEAAYGLGRMVILGFDAEQAPKDRWVADRLTALASDAAVRRGGAVFPAGDLEAYGGRPAAEVVRDLLLDRGAIRSAMIVATLLLVAFAILAGPVNFRLAWKRDRPARAVWILVAASIVTFVCIVCIGVMMRGTEGSSRRTIFADAGAGMSRGVAWRIRSYYTGAPAKMRVLPTRETSSLMLWRDFSVYQPRTRYGAAKEGAYLDDVDLQPWRMVFVRDDATIDLGGGLAVVGSNEPVPRTLTLVNRTGFDLEHVLVRLPDGTLAATAKIAPGASISTDAMTTEPPPPEAPVTALQTEPARGKTELLLRAAKLMPQDALRYWMAAEELSNGRWFPPRVPVVLAEVALPPERETDGGFDVSEQRTFVRFVGFGGTP